MICRSYIFEREEIFKQERLIFATIEDGNEKGLRGVVQLKVNNEGPFIDRVFLGHRVVIVL